MRDVGSSPTPSTYMQASIKGVKTDISINTVIITNNRVEPDNIFLLRCYKCGTAIKQIKGLVWSIVAGYIPSMEITTVDQCHNCKENYTTQSFIGVNRPSVDTTLTLSADPKVNTFHCVICRQPLMQYNKSIAALLPEFDKFKYPAMFTCFTPGCMHKYYLNDIVEPVSV